MLKSYFLVAWRSLGKNKISSFINIFGLSVGMAVAIFNGLWIWDEYSYNKYHQHYDRIGQIMTRYTNNGESSLNSTMSYALALELKNHYADNFEHYVISTGTKEGILSIREKQISGTGEYMGQDAPEMLTLKMIYGARSGLKDTYSILLSASLARSIFGNTDPVNRMMKINNRSDVKVTGVYEDLPPNTEFRKAQFIAPFNLYLSNNDWIEKRTTQDWTNHFLKVYAEIKPTSSFAKVSASIENAERRNARFFKNASFQEEKDLLYPMSQWHLYAPFRGKISAEPVHMVRLVGLTGIAVLLLACINFMNLSTARSEKRAREVGIRKTIGSGRAQLIYQFFSESLLVVLFAYAFALGLVILFLPAFNQLAAKQIAILWTNPFFWMASLIFIILTSLLAGSYPALYLSSFSPVKVLKGSFRVGRLASFPREVMVVVQFSISIILVICTLVVYRQIQYARSRPVGYDRGRIITMNMKSDDFYGKYDLLRTELKKTGAVTEMSESMGKVTEIGSNNGGFAWKGMDPKLPQNFGTITVTPSFGKTIGWKLIDGRDFSDNAVSDSSGVILTESAVKTMGLKNPVGENIRWTFWVNQESKNYTVLGVVKDMVMQSPYEPVMPTIFFIKSLNGNVGWINIKIANMPMAEALPKIETVFRKLIPSAPFEYQFVDEDYAKKFQAEQLVGRLATVFGTLAVFISCLGLFGLVSFVAGQRIREIGIRKVLGASVFNLWKLLSTRFVILVSISFLIAAPLALMIMHEWIQKYSYRTNLSVWIFIMAAFGALGITILTVSFQSIKAALSNPVESLRME
ncbi:MAG TPA: ABC transporter permease [Puia sp.]|jgi:putative ABC transport system permease protein|nr:ABC transporter permease [Puia sp.]